MPGKGNTVTYKDQPFRNWWDVHGEWDTVVGQHLGLALPPASPVKYSFEDGGLDGWSSTGNVTSVANSTAFGGEDGTHALCADFHSSSASDQPYLHANPSSGGPAAGQHMTAFVYVPSGTSSTVTTKLYIQDPKFAWHTASPVTVSARGSWMELSFTPSGYTGNAIQLGVQFSETPVNTPTTVCIDALNWA